MITLKSKLIEHLPGDSRRMTLRNSACGKLLVTVVEAADLIASSDGKSDPFCVIKVGENQESATTVVKNDLNPHWNYTVNNSSLFPFLSLLINRCLTS